MRFSRILRLNIIISYYIFTIGIILLTSACLYEDTIVPNQIYPLFLAGFLFEQMGTHFLRCLWIAVFVERAISTKYSHFYESLRNWAIPVFLPIISCGIAAFLVFGRLVCK